MAKIKVQIENSPYDVIIGKHSFSKLTAEIKKRNIPKNLFCVVDEKVYKLYRKEILQLKTKNRETTIFRLPASEQSKDLTSIQKIYSRLLKEKYGRDTTIIAIGGGVIGDVAGFAAATYMRGVQLIQVPTTLLAAVDSSIGGKTGVNFFDTKNIIGAFYQPNFVLVDTAFFNTLPKEEILSGLGEIIKYAFLTNEKLFAYLNKNINEVFALNPYVIRKLVSESIMFKGNVVAEDEKESGLRKILNLGHTFGHGIEVEQDYKLKHGAAVIVGIASSVFLSRRIGLITEELFQKYISILIQTKDWIKIESANLNKIYKIMQRDKKNRLGEIRLVLIKDVGKLLLDVTAGKREILFALENGIKLFR